MNLPMGNLPQAARATMAQIGPIWGKDIRKHRDMVLAAYAPLLRDAPKDGVHVTRDHAYGEHPRQRLDVFGPKGDSRVPVVAFVHGGAFIRGEKSTAAGIYDNVPYWFARQGFLGINIGYRLAPESTFPGGAEDIALAMAWVVRNVGELGGDPKRIYLMGHSAGATHIATYVADPNVRVKPGDEIRAVVLISGRLGIDILPENPNAAGVRAYFGDDPETYDTRSPMSYAHLFKKPVMIAIAEFENPLLDVYGAEFVWRISRVQKRAPRFIQMRCHNHSSMAMHFNTGDEILGRSIMDFFADHQ